jgi:hypothetical protein
VFFLLASDSVLLHLIVGFSGLVLLDVAADDLFMLCNDAGRHGRYQKCILLLHMYFIIGWMRRREAINCRRLCCFQKGTFGIGVDGMLSNNHSFSNVGFARDLVSSVHIFLTYKYYGINWTLCNFYVRTCT